MTPAPCNSPPQLRDKRAMPRQMPTRVAGITLPSNPNARGWAPTEDSSEDDGAARGGS
jgi:hypothetical protein